MSPDHALLFGPYRLDPVSGDRWRGREVLKLPPKPLAVLCYLAKHRGRLVSKEELLDSVWGRRWLSETVLKTTIKTIRRVRQNAGSAQVAFKFSARGDSQLRDAPDHKVRREPAGFGSPINEAVEGVAQVLAGEDEIADMDLLAFLGVLGFDPQQSAELSELARFEIGVSPTCKATVAPARAQEPVGGSSTDPWCNPIEPPYKCTAD